MKKSVYLDSTIPSYLFDERPDIKTYVDVTNKWWNEERSNFNILTSDETIAEISQGDYPKKDKILKFISDIEVLQFDDDIIEVAQVYLKNYVMPQKLAGDAIHLAYASISKIDFLRRRRMVTNHLLKEKEYIQKKLYDEVGHDLKKYVEKTHEIVEETEKKYGLNFHYSRRSRANSL